MHTPGAYYKQFLIYKHQGFTKSYREIHRRFNKKIHLPQLQGIFICPSHECNANCIHCYEKFENKPNLSLSTEKVKDIIDQFRSLHGELIYFCSGEFLLREDAIELIKYASNLKMEVNVTSNGLLIDKKKIEELKQAGMTTLIISIDSANEARHDEFRGVKGCYNKAVNALKMAHDCGLRTLIWTYITKTNYEELDGISMLAKQLKTELAFVYFPLLSGHLFYKQQENLSLEERETFRKRFNGKDPVLLEFPSESSLCRGGGNEHVCIMPTGDVTFCPPVPYSYGNIHKKSLRDILKLVVADYNKFCTKKCTGQCIVNFDEYRKNCQAKFIYN
jgi:MoaA/NifB/PqqE/SkfB family radical SAM enzyme